MSVVAVVPVKASSDRVQDKNFREFYEGKSLFELLIQKLQKSSKIDKIYVSSNASPLRARIEELGCSFIERDDYYCNNDISWSDVIAHVVGSLPTPSDTSIAWCHTTSPLFNAYDEAIEQYEQSTNTEKHNGLITVAELGEFVVNQKRQALNYSWGPWHQYSQYLDKLYAITGALFVAKKSEMLKNRYVISTKPDFFHVSKMQALDIDTPYDFQLAQLLMSHRKQLLSYA